MTVTKQLSIALQSALNDLISAVNQVRQIREQLQSWRNTDEQFNRIVQTATDLQGSLFISTQIYVNSESVQIKYGLIQLEKIYKCT